MFWETVWKSSFFPEHDATELQLATVSKHQRSSAFTAVAFGLQIVILLFIWLLDVEGTAVVVDDWRTLNSHEDVWGGKLAIDPDGTECMLSNVCLGFRLTLHKLIMLNV